MSSNMSGERFAAPGPFAAERVRLYILQALAFSPAYQAGGGVLRTALANMGCPASAARISDALFWLCAEELVLLERLEGGGASVQVATLTLRGLDAAQGRERVPGVMRPLPADL